MRVVANGKAFDIEVGTTVARFVEARGLDPRFVVVERNGQPLERSRYEDVTLADGDRLELVRAVAGGADRGAWRRKQLARARLYVVTGARRDRGDLPGFLDTLLEAGVDVVQLREKVAEARDLLAWGEVFSARARAHGALFVLNDRPDVAVALGADGVHVGQGDLAPGFARTLVGPDVLIGLSTHTPEQWDAADPEADYLCAGPVFETPTKPGRAAAGLAYVRHAASRPPSARPVRPWFAIGGVNADTLTEVIGAGATRVVVVRAVTEAEDAAGAVRALLRGLPPAER
jgi:thiamine-phosphate pyrophosphorylase